MKQMLLTAFFIFTANLAWSKLPADPDVHIGNAGEQPMAEVYTSAPGIRPFLSVMMEYVENPEVEQTTIDDPRVIQRASLKEAGRSSNTRPTGQKSESSN